MIRLTTKHLLRHLCISLPSKHFFRGETRAVRLTSSSACGDRSSSRRRRRRTRMKMFDTRQTLFVCPRTKILNWEWIFKNDRRRRMRRQRVLVVVRIKSMVCLLSSTEEPFHVRLSVCIHLGVIGRVQLGPSTSRFKPAPVAIVYSFHWSSNKIMFVVCFLAH